MFDQNGDQSIGEDFIYGKNISNTPNEHESGFMISPHGKLDETNGTLITYGACQYYDPDNLEPGSTTSVYAEQFLHVWRVSVDDVVGIQSEKVDFLKNFELFQNYPNPFNPTTTINYQIKENSFVKLSVFNSKGEEISILVNDIKSSGNYSIEFDGSDLNSGVYFYQLSVDGIANNKKMILTK